MKILPGRLGTLTARDVMTPDVVVVSEGDTVESAVAQLKSRHITGAPVVDDNGKLVGILSVADLVRQAIKSAPDADAPPVSLAHGDDVTSWDLFDRAQPLDSSAGGEQVKQRMTTSVTSVAEHAPLVEVARVMCSGHWHRVPVVDNTGGLKGIISTMDILAALVNTADEQE